MSALERIAGIVRVFSDRRQGKSPTPFSLPIHEEGTVVQPELVVPDILPDSIGKAWLRGNNTLFQHHGLIRMAIANVLIREAGNDEMLWRHFQRAPISEPLAQIALDNLDFRHGNEIPYHSYAWAERQIQERGLTGLERDRFLSWVTGRGRDYATTDAMQASFDRMRIQAYQALAVVIRILQTPNEQLPQVEQVSYNEVISLRDIHTIITFFADRSPVGNQQQQVVRAIMASGMQVLHTAETALKRDRLEELTREGQNLYSAAYNPHEHTGLIASIRQDLYGGIERTLVGYDVSEPNIRATLIHEAIWPHGARR